MPYKDWEGDAVGEFPLTFNLRVQAHRFFPSRYWSREIIEYERAQQGIASREGGSSRGGSSPDF